MFLQTSFVASAAIATNGTTTFSYPTRPYSMGASDITTLGDFRGTYGHVAFIESMQSNIASPKDFTLTFGNSNITFTWLGTQTIPVGSLIRIDLHTIGQDKQSPYGLVFAGTTGDAASQANSGPAYQLGISTKVQTAGPMWINFGCPVTASTTSVLATTAVADTVLHTLTTPFVFDVPRNAQVVSSTTDTTQTITIRGLDDYGVAMSETLTLNGATPVLGNKAFAQINSYQASIAMAGNLSIGSGTKLGVPVFVPAAGASLKDMLNGATATAGTWVAGVTSTPSATTGDVRGTYVPNTAPSTNTNTYESIVAIPDATYLGATQA